VQLFSGLKKEDILVFFPDEAEFLLINISFGMRFDSVFNKAKTTTK
jgi:hypothetical protein